MMILIGIPYALFVIYIIALTIFSLYKGIYRFQSGFLLGTLFFSEVVFTVIGPAIGFYRFDAYQPEIPFAKQHVLSIILLVIVSSTSFWIARLGNKQAHPTVKIFASVGMLQGIILCAVTSIHFIPFYHMGLIFPMFGFELLAPPVAMFLLIREFYFYNNTKIIVNDSLPYRQELGLLPLPVKIMSMPFFERLLVYAAILLIIIIAEAGLCLLAGQHIDSIIKAFTHSVGFIFSKNS
jgi:hypothetical protein